MVNKLTKAEIATLPAAVFDGKIIVIQDESECEKAISYLETVSLIGFDTETRPSFKKGQSNKIALVQLATQDTCFLFRLNVLGLSKRLVSLLTNPSIKKIGLSLKDDFAAMRKRIAFEPENFVELQVFVKKFGIEEMGLQPIYAILFEKRISKRQRLSNWEAEELAPSQQMYAALDAWACLAIYNQLLEIEKMNE